MDEFRQGVKHFNGKNYFEAHSAWEAIWLHAGEEKKFLQGLIQIAVGYHHYFHENKQGCLMLLERGAGYISAYPESYFGIDSVKFINEIRDTIRKISNDEKFMVPEIRWMNE